MKKLLSIFAVISLTLLLTAGVSNPPVSVTEEDGSPIVYSPYKIKFTNATVTDNADGTVSVSISGGGAPTDADYLVGTTNASLSAEIVVGATPGGELGGTWGSPTIDDSVAVTGWNLTTPTITTSLTTSTPTTISAAELDRLDGLAGVIVTDTTACTEIDGTNLTITAGTLNVDNPVVADVTGNVTGSSGSCTGNSATVTNATLTTALTVNTGAVTLTGNASGSTLTLGAGASSISGANTGDNTVATSGDAALDFFGAGVTAVTDATACTDIEGIGLTITAGVLNIDDAYLKLGGDVATAGTYDFGSASVVLEIPNAAAPTTNATGEMAIDTDLITQGMLQVYLTSAIANIPACTDTPADNEIPKYDSGTGTFTFETDAGGAAEVSILLEPQSAKLPASNPAVIDAGNSGWRLLFDDTTQETAVWETVLDDDYGAGTLYCDVYFTMLSGEANEVQWECYVMAYTPATDTADWDTDSYDTLNEGSATTVAATAGRMYKQSITLTNADSAAAGDMLRIKISTDSDDATNDDATGDREFRYAVIRE